MTVDRLAAAHDTLTAAIEGLVSGEDWAAMLDVARRFHGYSVNNVLLIYRQRPDATRVAGYRAWQALGRQVVKGTKGIAILAPCRYKTPDSDTEIQPAGEPAGERAGEGARMVVRGFRVVHVFDIADTEGDELADVRPELLTGDDPTGLWDLIAAQVTGAGFELVRGECGGANGTTSHLTRTVTVRADVEPAQAAKTLVHELAHVLLHADGAPCRGTAEVEAESVAYLVASAAGLDTSGYSLPYVARWSGGDVDLVRATATRAIGCARGILTAAGLDDTTAAREVAA